MLQDAGRYASEAAIGSSDKTKMFDSFETVSLGRDDNDNVVVEGPAIMSSQTGKEPLQPVNNLNHKMLKARTLQRGKPMKIPLNPLNSNLCP
ncbi:hypothetical protein PIB30_031332 [Stylosanthes scabra]|uniref:Uncharacterized protein n=1 Tax=Stylosanthes scabra TaxID=79078 RepID=A0ABU6TCK1_9FABA|nr:hypothetical protein [Stylosanthes scabra]